MADPLAVATETAVSTARADQLEARGSWLPSLSLTSGYSKSSQERINRATGLLSSESYTAGAEANLVLFAGGERLAENRATSARVTASLANHRSQSFETILRTTESFYEAAASRSLSELAAQRLERARQQLEFAQTRLEVGTATVSDVLRGEIEVGNAELSVLDAASDFRTAALNLGRWIGLAGEVQPIPQALPDRAPELPARETLVQRAALSSPLVVSSGAELEEKRADRLGGYSGFLPLVELTGGYDWSAADFPPNKQTWNLNLSATLPIFDRLQREATLQRHAALVRLAKAQARDAEIAVRVAVESALQEVESAEQRVLISDRARDLAREDLRVLEQRYQAEAASILDLQTSQVALTVAEIGVVRARQTLGTAVATLEAVLGESLEEIADD